MPEAKTISLICRHHGYVKGEFCPKCHVPDETLHVQTDSWIPGWWEHIAREPIYIRDRKHLIEECNKHGVLPKCLLKPKSQGKGWEASAGLAGNK